MTGFGEYLFTQARQVVLTYLIQRCRILEGLLPASLLQHPVCILSFMHARPIIYLFRRTDDADEEED